MYKFLLAGLVSFILSQTTFAQFSFPSHADGITIKAKDGSAKMNIGFRVQSLVTVEDPGGESDIRTTSQIRRSRLKSDGYFFNPKFAYKFEMGMSNRDVSNSGEQTQTSNAPKLILDAVVKYKISKSWAVWFGQTKLPGNRERVISSSSLQFVDRSLLNGEFNIDRDFGVFIWYKNQLGTMPFSVAGALTNGEGRNQTGNNTGGYSYTGRLEIDPFGSFTNKGDYFGADLEREQKPKLSVGVTYNFNQGASRNSGQLGSFITDSTGALFLADLSSIHADFMYKFKGWSWMTEYAIRTSNTDFASKGTLSGFYDLGTGFNTQIGYLLKSNFEVAGRYTNIEAADKFTSLKTRNQYTLCLSKYIVGHTIKWQSDISYTQVKGATDPSLMYRFQFEIGI